MSELLEFKCPHCGGKLEFDAAAQNMKCPYCDSVIDVASLQSNDAVLDEPVEIKTEGNEWLQGETDSINVYSCNSCGGEIVADENTGATHCPYCGNPVVMTSKFSGKLKPDYVIPFAVTKEQAKQALKNHYHGRKFLPKVFSSENHLDEIKGVYVPFWLFDADAKANVIYDLESVNTWSDSTNDFREVSKFRGVRNGTLKFRDVPVDGSEKISDEMMESIEPFDTEKAVKFQTAYLSGYLADKYDVDAIQSIERAKERMKASVMQSFAETVSQYSTANISESSVELEDIKAKYALCPVWLLTTSFNGNQYLFAVNGQSGKIVGDLPIDNSLVKRHKLIVTLAASAAVYGLGILLLLLGGML